MQHPPVCMLKMPGEKCCGRLPACCAGPGKVRLTTGCQFALPEWWGASGTGNTDDSTAIQSAYEAVQSTGETQGARRGRRGLNWALGCDGAAWAAALETLECTLPPVQRSLRLAS